eukprot:gene53821-48336_t
MGVTDTAEIGGTSSKKKKHNIVARLQKGKRVKVKSWAVTTDA